MKLQVFSTVDPACAGSVLGCDPALSGKEEDEEARAAQMSSPTSAWDSQVAAWKSSNQRDGRPALLPRLQRLTARWGCRWTWLRYIYATRKPCSCGTGRTERIVQKKKKRLRYITKHKHVAICHIDPKVQRSCRHYIHTYRQTHTLKLHLALLWNHIYTHNRAASISHHTHTQIHKHQRSSV